MANSDNLDNSINIYTDGSCSPNPGVGGYGIVFVFSDRCKGYYGYRNPATNSSMEMLAIFYALKLLDTYIKFVKAKYNADIVAINILTDSQYVLGGLTTWGEKHNATGWKGKSNNLKNVELWKSIHILKAMHKSKAINYQWVKAHNGNKGNTYADKLANYGRRNPSKSDSPILTTKSFN